jgi:hypothetical protein
MAEADPVSVSFVIPHKGREEMLQATLASIAAQDAGLSVDVTVVTQNATLAAATLAAATNPRGEPLDLRVLHADPALTISALRNLGAAQGASTHLAFLDADIELAPDWLRTLLGVLEADGNRALASAMQRSSAQASVLERIRTTLSNAAVDCAVDFLPGRNLLLRRAVFDTVGGFPEHLRTCEDYWFTDRVARHGSLWYASDTHYVHLGEDQRLGELFSKEVWRGQSNLQSLKGRHVGPGEWPSFLVPPWITGFTLAAVGLALAGQGLFALLCTALAGLPFAAYVTRLYLLGAGHLPLAPIVAFYAVYFPARAWGTLLGAFRSVGSHLHDH